MVMLVAWLLVCCWSIANFNERVWVCSKMPFSSLKGMLYSMAVVTRCARERYRWQQRPFKFIFLYILSSSSTCYYYFYGHYQSISRNAPNNNNICQYQPNLNAKTLEVTNCAQRDTWILNLCPSYHHHHHHCIQFETTKWYKHSTTTTTMMLLISKNHTLKP